MGFTLSKTVTTNQIRFIREDGDLTLPAPEAYNPILFISHSDQDREGHITTAMIASLNDPLILRMLNKPFL
jgi:hypothetical protein